VADLTNCQRLHHRLMTTFPTVPEGVEPRQHHGVLYRVDLMSSGRIEVIVQAWTVPNWSALDPGYLANGGDGRPLLDLKRVDALYDALSVGMRLRFRLVANPTRRVTTAAGQSKRVEVRGKEAQLAWLQRQGEQCGFAVQVAYAASTPAVTVIGRSGKAIGWKKDDRQEERIHRITIKPVQFEGLLEIVDVAAFRHALEHGIGPARAYGCGLLSIARS
jgi:CRISPR system Cascade subunit CasE